MGADRRDEPLGGGGELGIDREPSVPQQRDGGALAGATVAELPPSDADLIGRMRGGDDSAYEELYRRHAESVRRYARTCCRDAHTADDLTAEVFARTLQAVRGGAGPDTAVRAYLLTTVRRVAAAWTKSAKREQLVEDFALFATSAAGVSASGEDTLDLGADVRAMHEAEQSLAVQAFRSLPERWQTVLWHTTVEEESPSDVAPLLGLSANATAVLAHRAREGLKQAYLQAHVSTSLTAGGDCAQYADRLGAYARGGLRVRAERGLRKHLETCARCSTAAMEVKDVNAGLRALLPIAVIGWFAAGWAFKGAGVMVGAGAIGAAAGSGAAAAASGSGAGAGSGSGGAGAAASEGLGLPAKAGLAAAVVVAAAATVFAVTAGNGEVKDAAKARPPVSHAAPQEPAPKESPTPGKTAAEPSPESSSSQSSPAEPSPSASPSKSPEPSPTPTASKSPELTPSAPAPPPPPPMTTYRLGELNYDSTGDGSEPEVRQSDSDWMWKRDSVTIDGAQYAPGVTTGSNSSLLVDLNKTCTAYDAMAGVDDLSLGLGSVRFSVFGGGTRLWQSGVVHGGDAAVPVHVPLSPGLTSIRLVVEPAGELGSVGLADWAQAQFTCEE
ncbi:sigma-70 family RNA polymerase sigma factor [Streptomyces pathocidini]|uniref:Sigma-70 family RNA polymerase sigma factor n=1 Tax=Streptomyces pathocidini TaxID=1650571 RepID=A0ABW7V0I8_9ACTN|nr:sigma-70 family RNA polymerase sigma factor [Streptomyces pathocidini]